MVGPGAPCGRPAGAWGPNLLYDRGVRFGMEGGQPGQAGWRRADWGTGRRGGAENVWFVFFLWFLLCSLHKPILKLGVGRARTSPDPHRSGVWNRQSHTTQASARDVGPRLSGEAASSTRQPWRWVESIMVSAPPLIAWQYNVQPPASSAEAALLEVLRHPREWGQRPRTAGGGPPPPYVGDHMPSGIPNAEGRGGVATNRGAG